MSYLNYDNLVVVNDIADFPAPSGGTITLLANTTYVIRGTISFSDTMVIGSSAAIVGFNRFTDFLNYTGTGDMFTYSGTGAMKFEELGMIATNGRVFNLSGTTDESFAITNCYIASCQKVGVLNDIARSFWRSFSVVSATDLTTPGLQFTGTCTTFNADNSLWTGFSAGTMIDFGSVIFDRIQISTGMRFEVDSGVTGISGLVNSGNIASGGGGVISNAVFEGAGTYLNNILPSDLRWEIFGNANVPSTSYNAFLTLSGNATNTVIAAANTPVKVGTVSWVDQGSSRFTSDTGGRSTYIGNDDKTMDITARVSIAPAAGTNINMSAYLAINGSTVSYAKASGKASNGDPTSLTFLLQESFSTNDYIEIWVENNDNTNDLLVVDSSMMIRG